MGSNPGQVKLGVRNTSAWVVLEPKVSFFITNNRSFFSQTEHPSMSFPRIHGKAGVTDICFHDDHVYSCGRDGQYRVYRFTDQDDNHDKEENINENEEVKLEMLEANRVSATAKKPLYIHQLTLKGNVWVPMSSHSNA